MLSKHHHYFLNFKNNSNKNTEKRKSLLIKPHCIREVYFTKHLCWLGYLGSAENNVEREGELQTLIE